MPTTIIATVGDESANSYVTLSEANAYFGDRLHSSSWDSASEDDRNRALLWACKILDTRINWKGTRSSGTQALDWPRAYVVNPDFREYTNPDTGIDYDDIIYFPADEIPQWLKDAQCEQALALLGEDVTLDPSTAGFSTIGLPGLNLTVDKLDRRRVLTAAVRDLCAQYGEFVDQSRAGGVQMVRLRRA